MQQGLGGLSYPHRIRLRGPWQCQPLPDGLISRVTMPCSLTETGLARQDGVVQCCRRFGYPGRIDADERVWLTFDGTGPQAAVSLNGSSLGALAPGTATELEVTRLLRARNELIVDLTCPGAHGSLGEVGLEVRRTAWLRQVRAWLAASNGVAELHAAGEVVGEADGPLDLYLLWQCRPLVEAQVQASGQPQAFHLTASLESGSAMSGRVCVDLVRGSVVWYTICLELTGPVGHGTEE